MKSKKSRIKKRNKKIALLVVILLAIIMIIYSIYGIKKEQTNIQSKEKTEQELEYNDILENAIMENEIRRYN